MPFFKIAHFFYNVIIFNDLWNLIIQVFNNTSLNYAIIYGNVKIVELLLLHKDIDKNFIII